MKNLIKRADDHARKFTKQRDGYRCRECGSDNNIEWCHVFTRGCKNIRHHEDNNFTLCKNHHNHFDVYKQEFYEWTIEQIGIDNWEDLLELKAKPKPITKQFMLSVIEELKTKLRRQDEVCMS